MGFPRRDRRGESKTVGLFKMVMDPHPKKTEAWPFPVVRLPRMLYHAIPDKLFPGAWHALPVNYTGRGLVYILRTHKDAEAKAAEVNKRQGFK